ncbi:MarR family winged helix-turn-helix transcriptional regulator [Oleidesulfovibrio sp.]|uniref:MarR family winged helix-turn-helix transcriptional regulator n=1 Tax=Oleidesulfovibrio sp. TaxID=2909707 RepID=UPI003A86B4AE
MTTPLNTKYNNASESPGFLLWKASNKLQRLHRAALKEFDLSPTQFSVLASIVYLGSDEDQLTQALLCQHTQMDKMLVSDVVRALCKKQLVTRFANPADRRSFIITATSDGERLANKTVKIVESIDTDFFSDVQNAKLFMDSLCIILE